MIFTSNFVFNFFIAFEAAKGKEQYASLTFFFVCPLSSILPLKEKGKLLSPAKEKKCPFNERETRNAYDNVKIICF